VSNEKAIRLRINGRDERIAVPAHRTLLEALRELGHVEVKCGCEKGDCGACAVLIDGMAIDSCLTLAWMAENRDITTVAGMGTAQEPHPLQKAFIECGAVQCGYCTPGLIIAAQSLINENATPTDDDIRLALSGNLCRCTGYGKVFDAVRDASVAMLEAGDAR